MFSAVLEMGRKKFLTFLHLSCSSLTKRRRGGGENEEKKKEGEEEENRRRSRKEGGGRFLGLTALKPEY